MEAHANGILNSRNFVKSVAQFATQFSRTSCFEPRKPVGRAGLMEHVMERLAGPDPPYRTVLGKRTRLACSNRRLRRPHGASARLPFGRDSRTKPSGEGAGQNTRGRGCSPYLKEPRNGASHTIARSLRLTRSDQPALGE